MKWQRGCGTSGRRALRISRARTRSGRASTTEQFPSRRSQALELPCMNPVLSHLKWFDVADPASPELDELAQQFELHELQIEDCRHRPQRPKTEEHDHYIFTVLKHIHD